MNLQSRDPNTAEPRSERTGAGSVAQASPRHAPHMGSFNIIFFSTWVSVCSVAPEFIWQGLRTVIRHFDWVTVGSALLVGAIVAFFVEPLTERLRAMQLHVPHKHKTPVHATVAAFAFAVLAVCVHEAITSFVFATYANDSTELSLLAALADVFQWSSIPFVITIAWLCANRAWWISWPTLLLAALTVVFLGVVSNWSRSDTVTTAIPCACILFFGLIVMRRYSTHLALSRCARLTTIIALLWLISGGIIQLLLWLFGTRTWHLYSWMEYTIDFRFYVGWVIGLAVAPRPALHH
jgi:hypothetical protein